MYKSYFYLLCAALTLGTLSAQPTKQALDHADVAAWNDKQKEQLSANGRWVSYEIAPAEGDPTLVVYDALSGKEQRFHRGHKAQFSADSRYVAFVISPPQDSIKALKRKKVKEKKWPKDSLVVLALLSEQPALQIARVQSFQLPQKWAGWLAYHHEPAPRDTSLPDSIKVKLESEKNGSLLVLRNLENGMADSIPFVKSYVLAEEGARLLLHTSGKDSTLAEGVYWYDCASRHFTGLMKQKGDYQHLQLDKKGGQAAFLVYPDTAKAQAKPFQLYYWKTPMSAADLVADSSSQFVPDKWLVSEHSKPYFSEDGQRLFFGVNPAPILKDTTLLPEETVSVEVWTYQDDRLYTQQEVMLDAEKKRSYTCVFDIATKNARLLHDESLPEIRLGNEGKARYALAWNEKPYLARLSWEGYPVCKDVYLIDLQNGERQLVGQQICGNPSLSPEGKYVYWYSQPDSTWYAYEIEGKFRMNLTAAIPTPFYDEQNDRPMHPDPYGLAGWTSEDDFILLCDRYDVWLIDPDTKMAANNLTKGRTQQKQYRYIKLDPEERAIEEVKPMLFHVFDEKDKASGYAWFNIHTGVLDQVQQDAFYYSPKVLKAKEGDAYLFSRENFRVFPDLLYSKDHLKSFAQISDINPQQKNFYWGNIEIYEWKNKQGQPEKGLLIKPDGFDPKRQYPMMTYFYERYTDDLHRHPTPKQGRSSINFAFYASRGYVIFVPDIYYRVGYPGESALEVVTSGVESLIEAGFVDKKRIGVQGHSWGGYQVAYLITKTDLFACAESGAPVVNMTSAYGGIRWESGLSRMFQYERTQSRLGVPLWENPSLYLENSPLFYADKINTPVLILHNDQDGAVPWYQGIEFFVALRRLNKPAWLLNYNDEKHGLTQYQNKVDFQTRMQQFFDYYLMDGPMPKWMQQGVSPLEKGILQKLD